MGIAVGTGRRAVVVAVMVVAAWAMSCGGQMASEGGSGEKEVSPTSAVPGGMRDGEPEATRAAAGDSSGGGEEGDAQGGPDGETRTPGTPPITEAAATEVPHLPDDDGGDGQRSASSSTEASASEAQERKGGEGSDSGTPATPTAEAGVTEVHEAQNESGDSAMAGTPAAEADEPEVHEAQDEGGDSATVGTPAVEAGGNEENESQGGEHDDGGRPATPTTEPGANEADDHGEGGPFSGCYNVDAPLAEDQEPNFLTWSPDGSMLLYNDEYDIVVLWATDFRTSTIVEAEGSPYYGVYASFRPGSPDIVLAKCYFEDGTKGSLSTNYEIAMLAPELKPDSTWSYDKRAEKRITFSESFDHYPVWSPDGSSIAYISTFPRVAAYAIFSQIFVMDGESGDRRPVTAFPWGIAILPPVWLQDGKSLLVYAYEAEDSSLYREPVLHRIDVESGLVHRLGGRNTPVHYSPRDAVVVSPKGDRLARIAPAMKEAIVYISYTESPGEERAITVAEPGDYEAARMVRRIFWSPNGDELVVVVEDEDAGMDSTSSIYVLRTDGGEQRTILAEGGRGLVYVVAWSRDGTHLAIRGDDRDWIGSPHEMFIIDRNGTERRTIVDWIGYR